MRKIGALSMAAFYLLLTTGAFACLLHCTEEYLLTGTEWARLPPDDDHDTDTDHHDGEEQSVHHQAEGHQKKDDCGPGKDCNCCNKHGNYVVKENVSPSYEFQVTAMALALKPVSYQEFTFLPDYALRVVTWPHTTGPPANSQPPIYISIQSLLI